MTYLKLLILFFFPWIIQAQVDPAIHWRTLDTDHFEVIFSKGSESLARAYAFEAERAYADLKPVFKEVTEKTIVVILDNTDLTNGYASFLPYAQVVIYPVMPADSSSVSYYADWARELMIHEYTHILSFQPSHGFYTPFRWILGTIVRPNAILPRWFLEGIAVQVESRYSNFGRLRSPGTQGTLRALVLSQNLRAHTLSHINETSIPTYPFGRRPYLFGSLLWQEILENTDAGVVERLHQRYSRRVPFFLNAPIEDETKGKSYTQLLADRYRSIELKVQSDIRKIIKSGVQKDQRLTNLKGQTHTSPRISPDSRHLAFFSHSRYLGAQVHLASKTKKSSSSFLHVESQPIASVKGGLKIDWHPSSNRFVFEKVSRYKRYYFYSDLYEYNIKTKKTTRLTRGARAREASYSPDGKKLAFVQLHQAQTSLSILNLENKKIEKIITPRQFNRFSHPFWLDKNILAVVARNRKGQQALYSVDLFSVKRTLKRLLPNFKHVSQPLLTKNGIIFMSYDSGVTNLYLSPAPFKKATPVSNTRTHILNADWDPETQDYIISQSTGFGPRLYSLKGNQNFQLQKVSHGMSLNPFGPISSISKKQIKMSEDDFWGVEYLRPRYWVPFIFPVEGGAIFQGQVTGQDPLSINSYFLNGSFDTATEKFSYGVGYLNKSTPIDLYGSYSEFQNFLPVTGQTFTNRFSTIQGSFFIPGLSHNWRGNVGAVYEETEDADEVLKGLGPTTGISYSTAQEDLNSNRTTKSNFLASVNHTEYYPQDGFYSFGKTRGQIFHSNQLFLPPQHAVSLALRGTYAPRMRTSDILEIGDKTIGGNYLVNVINTTNLMRGYPTGGFTGRLLANGNIEYNFPLKDLYHGKNTTPLFLRNLKGTVFFDFITIDGGYLNSEFDNYFASNMGEYYTSTGVEFHLNTTVAYHLPVTFTLGLYYGLNSQASGGFIPFVSLGYTGHGGVGKTQLPPSVFSF